MTNKLKKSRSITRLAGAILAIAGLAGPIGANAAQDMFIQFNPQLRGSSTDKMYGGYLPVLEWSWGLSQSGTMHMATGGGAGKVNVRDLSFTHPVDGASANLIQRVATGRHFDSAKLVIRKTGENPIDVLVIEIKNVLVTSVTTGGSGGQDFLTETVTLNFAEYTYTYTPQRRDGSKDATIETSFNIVENAVK